LDKKEERRLEIPEVLRGVEVCDWDKRPACT